MPMGRKQRTSPKKVKSGKPKISAKDLLEAADQAMHVQDPQQALHLYTAALVQTSDEDLNLKLDILEKRAGVKVSVADQEGALEDYRQGEQLIRLEDGEGSSQIDEAIVDQLERKAGFFLYIGQLSEGEDALSCSRSGIALLERALKVRCVQAQDLPMTPMPGEDTGTEQSTKDPQTLMKETQQQLASALCTAADLYMTDLCFEENAESECQNYVDRALALESDEPDALQTAASLRLSQSRGLEAVDLILGAYEKMREGCEALAALVGMREGNNPDQASELADPQAVQKLPGFEFRCQTAKILLESAEYLRDEQVENKETKRAQCLQAAIDVLGSLMAENDEVVETWCLAGDAFAALSPAVPDLAVHYWQRAEEMLQGVRSSMEDQLRDAMDEEEEEELNQALEDVMCKLDTLNSKLSQR